MDQSKTMEPTSSPRPHARGPASSNKNQPGSKAQQIKDVFDSVEEWSEPSDSGSDFEPPAKRRSRKRTAHSEPARSPVARQADRETVHKRAQRNTAQAHRTPPRASETRSQQVTAAHLYEAVRGGRTAMRSLIDDFLEGYKQDKEAELLELINFIVMCSGCKGVVNRKMFANMQNAQIISRLTREFDEDSGSYPLCSPGVQWKKFRVNLCEFFSMLVHRCQNSLLYDETLFSSLIALLTGMSDSQVRAFRHTSTLIVLKLMTALVEVSLGVGYQRETCQRLYEAELGKELQRQAPAKLEELRDKLAELQEQQEEMNSMINSIFKGVFVHRYRDILPEIRALCMEEIGLWMKIHSESFLNDGYLKYLGWTLHDKQGAVRLKCLKALQGLYSEKDFIGRLELFTNRFKERILSMVLDKEVEAAVEAVHLLVLIQQNTEDVLTQEDCDNVYLLVFSSHRGLASAAGTFLYNRLCSKVEGDSERMEVDNRRMAIIKLLLSFYIQTELHEHGAYLVDSLWDSASAELKDWQTMTELLLGRPGEEEGLGDEEESALIELMVCAVKQAAEGQPPIGRVSGKRVQTAKEKKTRAQDRIRLTGHFIIVLPQLLAKYSADVEKVTCLLQTPLHFNMDIYCTGRLEKYLELLLDQVSMIAEKHTNDGVLDACARVFSELCSDCYTFAGRSNVALSQLVEGLVDRFTTTVEDLLQGTLDEDEQYGAVANLKRIAALYNAKDLTRWELFDPCYQILNHGVQSGHTVMEVMVPALKSAFLHVMWELVRVVNSQPSKAQLSQLKQHTKGLIAVFQSCLSMIKKEIRDQAFLLLCDFLIILSPKLAKGRDDLQTVVFLPPDALRLEMASFVMDYVFVEEEVDDKEEDLEKMEDLHRRRNQLAGYCKLIVYNVLDLSAATDVFKHFVKFYKDFGDIIKETLSRAKLINRVQCAKTVCLSLQQLFTELVQDHGVASMSVSPEFGAMRDLAHRLAMTFGIELHSVREALVALHKDGIRFAFRDLGVGDRPPENLHFLEILSEFSFKLIKQDRALLANFLQRMTSSTSTSSRFWPPMVMYQRSLQTGEKEAGGWDKRSSVSRTSPRTPASRPRRKRATAASSPSVKETAWLDQSSSFHSKLQTPPLTSTVLKKAPQAPSDRESEVYRTLPDRDRASSERGSEADFTNSPPVRSVSRKQAAFPTPTKTRALPNPTPTPTSGRSRDLDSQLHLLSLIEEDEDDNQEELEIDDDEGSGGTSPLHLPSTRYQHSGGFLEDLFD
uniref:Cohesin subunit SA n=1 Tax=Lepisosteus oculatus TaxID=7918 RepID=W5N691_LEPOC|nr:PREDICTED: cohesin subunit SA-3 [Lepisosteus oculatus]XP_015195781.1 PREDICTED: cohesin subunit SA-3 [Lepisosteus oculatus]XP_015195782.1 PREDICTED: cohesin subunit SA-3 [Lepisosteus oculatus]XP_015195783.1 PREDICTED: cohesin subunit SA-3 [Lepisosteus oculatus]